jgi:hypothetical protein
MPRIYQVYSMKILISSGFFCLVPNHFLIEYLSASEKSSCKLAISDLVSQHMKASEIQAKKSKPKLDGIA